MHKVTMFMRLTLTLLCASFYFNARAELITVACIGNSVTYGYGLSNREKQCYPNQLQQLLGNDYVVKNFGHSGATLFKQGHNPYYKTQEYTEALAFRPNIVIIHLGLNDTDPRDWPGHKESFEADYAWLVSELRKANPAMKIFICKLTPIFSGHPRFKSGTLVWYDQIQQVISQISAANHTGLIDFHTPLHDRPDLFADNLHPDSEGAGILAKVVYQAITKIYGGFKLSPEFASHMVLQRQQPICIYGSANTGDIVKVAFNHHILKTTTDDDGTWSVKFPAMQAGGAYKITLLCKDSTITLNDILIGDVWLCSGQSNMAFPLSKSSDGNGETSHADNNQLRLYQFDVLKETDAVAWDTLTLRKVNQLHYFSGTWKVSNSISAANFSAAAYYFGRKLVADEQVPIGLIQVAVGGSPIESWIDRYTMEHDPLMADELNNWRKSDFYIPFCRDRADTNLRNATSINQRHPYEPCYNYEAGIAKLTRFPIKGVIWYQGESNAHNIELYQHLLPATVKSWREKWGINFPFYYVQLAGINRPSWPDFRDMERRLQKQIPNIRMAVSMDVGDSLNVHYTNKKPVGERLALLALKYTYGHEITADGPDPVYAKRNGNVITVFFPVAEKLAVANGKTLIGFEVIDAKGERLPVDGVIRNNKIMLQIPVGEEIKAVWYAMRPFTRANLTNRAGLPASTFKMDLNRDNLFY